MLTFCFFNPRVRTTLRARRLLYCSCSIRVALAGKIIWLQNGAKTCSRSCSCCFATFSNRPQFQFSLRIGLFDHLLWRYAMQYIHSFMQICLKVEPTVVRRVRGGRTGWADRRRKGGLTGQRREVREEVTQPNTLNEKNKYKYKYKQRIIMEAFEMPSYEEVHL